MGSTSSQARKSFNFGGWWVLARPGPLPLAHPPTSRYDLLVVFLPSPDPCPPQPPPTSLRHSLVGPPWPWPALFQPPTSCYDSLVAHSPQPWSSPTPTATNEFMTLIGGSSLALAFLPCPIHQQVVMTCWWFAGPSPGSPGPSPPFLSTTTTNEL